MHLMAENQVADDDRRRDAGQIGAQAGRNRMAGATDSDRSEIDRVQSKVMAYRSRRQKTGAARL